MLIHRCFGTDLQLAFVIRRSGKDFKDKVSPGMNEKGGNNGHMKVGTFTKKVGTFTI